MTKPGLGAHPHTDEEVWIDPRIELTAIIHDLSDHASQVLLDYLREWLKTSAHTLFFLLMSSCYLYW